MNAHLYGTPDEIADVMAVLCDHLDYDIARFGMQLRTQLQAHLEREEWSTCPRPPQKRN